jgi:hypothetical protein
MARVSTALGDTYILLNRSEDAKVAYEEALQHLNDTAEESPDMYGVDAPAESSEARDAEDLYSVVQLKLADLDISSKCFKSAQ